jgi:hypothetical protein
MELGKAAIDNTTVHFLKGDGEPLVQCIIEGLPTSRGFEVVNSVPGKNKNECLYNWKCKIADEINKNLLKPKEPTKSAISLSFFFSSQLHGYRTDFDVENFVKPVIDGIAKGLYSKSWTEEISAENIRFNENDSLLYPIFIERHEIAGLKDKIFVTVWEMS